MWLRRAAIAAPLAAIILAAVFWFLTAPQPLAAAALPDHQPDPASGERIFYAAGCRHCHSAPENDDPQSLELAGGLALDTPFGTFHVPNISPDPQSGIGGWSTIQFVNAVARGVSPGGEHYYPAFPYASYARMRVEDLIDLKAFMDTLPPVRSEVGGHDLAFPYNVRRGLGLWKRLYLDPDPVLSLPGADEQVQRGQYLTEGPGHCGECHTARDALGAMQVDQWLAGAPNPVGRGAIPNLTPHEEGLHWSQAEIAEALKTGLTPDFDQLSGPMAAVVADLSHLPDADLQAIAAYLKAVPPRPDAVQRQPAPAE